jgi:predicted dehydrogenase
MASKGLQVGFIGAGGMAQSHMKSVAQLADVKIAAICDVDEARAHAAAKEYRAAAYTEVGAMLRKRLDAIYIVLPPFAHGEVEKAVIKKGLPFLVEKPVALSMKLGEKILDGIEKKNLITSAGYQLRYMTSIQQAKAFLTDKTIGMLVGYYWSEMIRGAWWPFMEKSGGQVVEQATHIVDLMRDLGGEIVDVDARMEQRVHTEKDGITIPDTYSVRFGYANGAMGTLTTCCLAGEWNIGLDIMVDRARLHWKIDELTATPDSVKLPPVESFVSGNIDEVFLNAVKTGDRSAIRSDYRDALKTLKVTLAATESAAKKKTIVLK